MENMAKRSEMSEEARLAARVRGMLGIEEDPNVKVGINGFGRMGRLVKLLSLRRWLCRKVVAAIVRAVP